MAHACYIQGVDKSINTICSFKNIKRIVTCSRSTVVTDCKNARVQRTSCHSDIRHSHDRHGAQCGDRDGLLGIDALLACHKHARVTICNWRKWSIVTKTVSRLYKYEKKWKHTGRGNGVESDEGKKADCGAPQRSLKFSKSIFHIYPLHFTLLILLYEFQFDPFWCNTFKFVNSNVLFLREWTCKKVVKQNKPVYCFFYQTSNPIGRNPYRVQLVPSAKVKPNTASKSNKINARGVSVYSRISHVKSRDSTSTVAPPCSLGLLNRAEWHNTVQ